MPVIINDLEIIIEDTESAPREAGAASAATPAPDEDMIGRALAPRTLEQIDRHRRARTARIRGH